MKVVRDTFSYRFGFNGYENEPMVAGQGSVIDFGMRIYDSRLGKFFSTDPINFPYWSPYQYDGNSPITIKDVLGMGPGDRNDAHTTKDHKVQKNETLAGVANKYEGVDIGAIKKANPQIDWDSDKRSGDKKDWLYVGETLNIPISSSAGTSSENRIDPSRMMWAAGEGPNKKVQSGEKHVPDATDHAVMLVSSFTPMGVIDDINTLVTGEDYISGDKVSWGWRLAGVIPLVSEGKRGKKITQAVIKASEVANKFPFKTMLSANKLLKASCDADAAKIQKAIGGDIFTISNPLAKMQLGPIKYGDEVLGGWYYHKAVKKGDMSMIELQGQMGCILMSIRSYLNMLKT